MDGSFIQLLFNNPQYYAAAVMTIILSITLHELAHGYAAIKLGDRTPEWTGHMTWNPWVHMGPFSLVACFLVGLAWGQMPVDSTRLKGRHAEAIVAAAGPATNLVLAFLALTALGLWQRFGGPLDMDNHRVANGTMVLFVFGSFNLLLCVFNLLPVPPLDGSRIVATYNRGYADFVFNPANQGVGIMLFVLAFILLRTFGGQLFVAAGQYVALIAG
ncbi:MAG: site-2 protease family protein [Planctomycetota bacterium]